MCLCVCDCLYYGCVFVCVLSVCMCLYYSTFVCACVCEWAIAYTKVFQCAVCSMSVFYRYVGLYLNMLLLVSVW